MGIRQEFRESRLGMHLEARDDRAPQRRVVVDERDRAVFARAHERRREFRAARAGAVDDDVRGARAVGQEEPAEQHAARAHVGEQEARKDNGRREPKACDGAARRECEQQRRRHGDARSDHEGRARPHVADDRPVEADPGEDRQAHDHRREHGLRDGRRQRRQAVAFQRQGEVHGDRDAEGIRGEHDESLARPGQPEQCTETALKSPSCFASCNQDLHPCRPKRAPRSDVDVDDATHRRSGPRPMADPILTNFGLVDPNISCSLRDYTAGTCRGAATYILFFGSG